MTKEKIAAAALILSGFLSPGLQVFSGLPVFRGENIVVLSLLAYVILRTPVRGLPCHAWGGQVSKTFGLMAYIAVISICLPAIVFDTDLILNDWMILFMLLSYWAVYVFFRSIDRAQTRLYCLHALLTATALCALAGILQRFNLLGINHWLTPLYAKGSQISSLIGALKMFDNARIAGTHGDPRHYGYLLVAGAGVCVSYILNAEKKTILQSTAVVLICGACIVSISYTLSRTAAVSFVLCVVTAIFLSVVKGRSFSRTSLLIFVIICLLSVWQLAFYRASFQSRVMDIGTDSFRHSKAARIRDLTVPFKDALEKPIIWVVGRGPSKAVMRTDSHNDIGWYFHRFGLLATLCYLSLPFWGIRNAYRKYLQRATGAAEKVIAMSTLLAMVNWAVFLMAENIFKDGQVMTVNLIFMGLLYPASTHRPTDASVDLPKTLR